ncbi:DJ-1/PfpI family protein [Sphingopyxis granuli]|uniref:DJ-1/PfpI family protein n=1 Tax=Sphingopyxis granuli TaxID=267128 RepID=UPI001BAE590D|nr:DJ-1/PfpI family protein [Sphingopyxis granuli]QUM74633.1 DJ-1/PfpI family protein [Sphingopyxis granuli]
MKIVIFLFDGVTALDPIGVYDSLSRLPEREIAFVSATGDAVWTGDGTLQLQPRSALADIDHADILLIPGGSAEGLRDCIASEAIKCHILRLDQQTTITGSVCSGSLILAATGLLRDRKVTTHWRAKEYLAPYGATYTGERITVDGKYWTSAGVTAGIDLGLRICEDVAGRSIAAAIELAMEYAPEPPFGTGDIRTAPSDLRDMVERVLNG